MYAGIAILKEAASPSYKHDELLKIIQLFFLSYDLDLEFFQPNSSNILHTDSTLESSFLNPVNNVIFPLVYLSVPFDSMLEINLLPYIWRLNDYNSNMPYYISSRGLFYSERPIRLSWWLFEFKVYLCTMAQDPSFVLLLSCCNKSIQWK